MFNGIPGGKMFRQTIGKYMEGKLKDNHDEIEAINDA